MRRAARRRVPTDGGGSAVGHNLTDTEEGNRPAQRKRGDRTSCTKFELFRNCHKIEGRLQRLEPVTLAWASSPWREFGPFEWAFVMAADID
jgi:hypothetical protein